MTRLTLSIACEAYDRVQGLRDGRVRIEGCDHRFLVADHERMFLRAFHHAEYDVSELSMSSYLLSVARGENAYVAVPVFPSRLFRHSAIYLNAASGIREPADLAGRVIGVPEYQITAALWVRGLLDDDYGVSPRDLRWRRGGLHETGRGEKMALDLPADIAIEDIPADRTLDAMLSTGEIDALISARAPRSYLAGDPRVVRLFPDFRAVERDYWARTGAFPIMHVLAVRRTLVEAHPWLPNAVYDAFAHAKALAEEDYSDVSALRVTLPWFAAELEETRALMGPDPWPYGVAANLPTLSRLLDYAHRHGTTPRRLALEEVFAPSTLVESRV